MPTYLFVGAYPRVLTSLSEGVNAHLEGAPHGSTLQPNPGDVVVTDEPYVHVELELIPDAAPAPEPEALEPVPVEPEAVAEPASPDLILAADEFSHLTPDVLAVVEAAQHDMTAEGAPAPEQN